MSGKVINRIANEHVKTPVRIKRRYHDDLGYPCKQGWVVYLPHNYCQNTSTSTKAQTTTGREPESIKASCVMVVVVPVVLLVCLILFIL